MTHTKSAICELVYVHRLVARLRKLRLGSGNDPGVPSTFGAIDNGYFTTVGGEGPCLINL